METNEHGYIGSTKDIIFSEWGVAALGLVIVVSSVLSGILLIPGYGEYTVSITGSPVTPPETAEVLSQEEMTAAEYAVAGKLLGSSVTVRNEIGVPVGEINLRESEKIFGFFGKYKATTIEVFLQHEYVKLGDSVYQVSITSRQVPDSNVFPSASFMFAVLGALLLVMGFTMGLSKRAGTAEG